MRDSAMGLLTTLAVWGSLAASIVFPNQFEAGSAFRVLGLVVLALGVLLFLAGSLALRHVMTRSFTPKALVTTGVYGMVRHPTYLGGALILAGLGGSRQSVVGLCMTALLAWPAYWWSAAEEERRLLDSFGSDYAAYRDRTWI